MKDFPGTPGTFLGLVLRMSQFIFGVGSIASMGTTSSFFNVTAFRLLNTTLLFYSCLGLAMKPSDPSSRPYWDSFLVFVVGFFVFPLNVYPALICFWYDFHSYLIASMGLLVIWSFVLALFDAYALVRKKVLHNPVLVSLFLVGDWVTAILSLAAASASAGVAILYFNDVGHCHFGVECQKYQISVALAFLSWISISISSLIMVWLLAAG